MAMVVMVMVMVMMMMMMVRLLGQRPRNLGESPLALWQLVGVMLLWIAVEKRESRETSSTSIVLS